MGNGMAGAVTFNRGFISETHMRHVALLRHGAESPRLMYLPPLMPGLTDTGEHWGRC